MARVDADLRRTGGVGGVMFADSSHARTALHETYGVALEVQVSRCIFYLFTANERLNRGVTRMRGVSIEPFQREIEEETVEESQQVDVHRRADFSHAARVDCRTASRVVARVVFRVSIQRVYFRLADFGRPRTRSFRDLLENCGRRKISRRLALDRVHRPPAVSSAPLIDGRAMCERCVRFSGFDHRSRRCN